MNHRHPVAAGYRSGSSAGSMEITAVAPPAPPGVLLGQAVPGHLVLGEHLRGFGGIHGGLALALMTSAMQRQATGEPLRSATARYHRAIAGEFRIEVTSIRSGQAVRTLAARATGQKGLYADATGVFGPPLRAGWPLVAPRPPAAPSPADCEVFPVPSEFVPISAYLEIRPVGPSRPYGAGTEPALTAWVRLREDDHPPGTSRLILLMDALAPSYAAILSTLAPIPTVELTVRTSENLTRASSPWVLLQAQTRAASADGWIDEEIQAWGLDGAHLGSAQQLRLMRAR
jgi:Thioesterase-like superfamily